MTGRYFEDFSVGELHRHALGRTITQTDNIWFTLLTLNTNPVHFDAEYAARTSFGRPLVNSCLTLSLVTGISVADISQNAMANLGWTDVRLPNPVFEGDTVHAESEIIAVRASGSRPDVGVVTVRTRGFNQRGVTVIEFTRAMLIYRRGAGPASASQLPEGATP